MTAPTSNVRSVGIVDENGDVIVTAVPGQKLQRLPEGASYLGFIFANAATPAEAEAALRHSHAQLTFRIATALDLLP